MAKKIEKEGLFLPIKIGKKNIYLFLLGIAMLIVGNIFLAQPPVYGAMSITIAPIIMVIAYLIIFPASILAKDSKKS